MRTPEGYEKAEIKKYLASIDAWFFSPYMAGYGTRGVPDIVGSYRGRFFGIEVKQPNKILTPMQKRCMEQIKQSGAAAFWGTSSKVIPEFETWRVRSLETPPTMYEQGYLRGYF